MHIQRYLLSLPSSLFIPAINPSKPETIPWTLGPHTPAEWPFGQRESATYMRTYGTRQALSTCKAHPCRHSIHHVTRIVMQTMDVNNRHRGGSNYRCQACTFRIKRFHNGSCAVGVSLFIDHFLSGKGRIISTCVTTTETMNHISHYFYFQNH